MADKEIRTRITAEDEASQTLKGVSDEQSGLARETDEASEAGDRQARSAENQQSIVGRLTTGVAGMVAGFSAFNAVSSVVVDGLRNIGREARETLGYIERLAQASRDLSVNIGGDADPIIRRASEVAVEHGLGASGRTQLLELAGSATERPEFANDPDAVRARIEQAAPLAAISDDSGAQIDRLLVGLSQAGYEDEFGAAAYVMSGPVDSSDAQRVLQRGGRSALEVLIAGLQQGDIDERRFRRGFPQILESLTEEDERGRIVPELQELGIEEGMDTAERLRIALEARAGDDPGRAAIARDRLGRQGAEFAPALRAMFESGTLEYVRDDIMTTPVNAPMGQMRESVYQQQQASIEGARLREQVANEELSRSDRAIREQAARAVVAEELQDSTSMMRGLRTSAIETMMEWGVPPEVAAGLGLHIIDEGGTYNDVRDEANRLRQGGNITININQPVSEQYNLSEDGRSRLTEPSPEIMD